MSLKCVLPVTLVALAVVGSISFADEPSTQPSTRELLEQIQALQAKVQQLEANQRRLNRADVDATVKSLLDDAQRRSQMLSADGALLAGWDNGHFFLRSADNSFLLIPGLGFQFWNTTNYNDEGSSTENGFEIHR